MVHKLLLPFIARGSSFVLSYLAYFHLGCMRLLADQRQITWNRTPSFETFEENSPT